MINDPWALLGEIPFCEILFHFPEEWNEEKAIYIALEIEVH